VKAEPAVSDAELQRTVWAELRFDPRVDASAIAVSAVDGRVTLRGTVGSFHEKRAAGRAAARVRGVASVENELEVRLLTARRLDDDLRGSVLRALQLDSLVPQGVHARVDDGWVTLTGTVDWQYQREEAARVAGNVLGVVGIDNAIEVSPAAQCSEVRHLIHRALARSASVDAEKISVDVQDGTVVLGGTIASSAEREAAVAAAWSAPGTKDVADHLVYAARNEGR